MDEFLELRAEEYPNHGLLSSILDPSTSGPNKLSADSLPRSLFEFSKHLWRIKQEETRSATCCEFYDACILEFAELAREDGEFRTTDVSLTFGDCPSKLTELLLVKRLSQRCEDARLIHACLISGPASLQTAKNLVGTHSSNIWIRKMFVELLAMRAQHWDRCVLRGAAMINSKDFDYDPSVTEHLQRATDAAQSLWEETHGLMSHEWSTSAKTELTCEHLVRQWGNGVATRFDLDRQLRAWSAARRELNESALLKQISAKVVNALEWLRDSYLLHRESDANLRNKEFNQVATTLRFIAPSLGQYEVLGESTQLLIDAHSTTMRVHWDILKAEVLEPRPREMAFVLWSILDGVFRAIGAFWTDCVRALNTVTTMTEFREHHQDYLDRVGDLFEDGSIKRLCESVSRFCSLTSAELQHRQSPANAMGSSNEDLLRSVAYKTFKERSVYVTNRSQYDTAHGSYFFFF